MEDKRINAILSKVTQSIQEIVGKLRFLAKIKKGERLCIDSLSIVDNTWISKLTRAWNTYTSGTDAPVNNEQDSKMIPESREKTFQFIKNLYEEGFRLANAIVHENGPYYTDLWNMLIKGLRDGQPGIANLMIYYEKDRLYIANVETFVDLLNAKITNLENERARLETINLENDTDEMI